MISAYSFMHPKSIFAVREWKLPEILLLAVACFALAAFGFFIAVFLQLRPTDTQKTNTTLQEVPSVDKEKVMQQTSDTGEQRFTPPSPPGQADIADPRASEKLKLIGNPGSN